jgi:hypothetical protein
VIQNRLEQMKNELVCLKQAEHDLTSKIGSGLFASNLEFEQALDEDEKPTYFYQQHQSASECNPLEQVSILKQDEFEKAFEVNQSEL